MHELADMIKLAASLNVDRVKGHHLWDHFEEIKPMSMKFDQESMNQWNEYVDQAIAAAEQFRRADGTEILLENIIPMEKNGVQIIPDHYECPFLEKELWISATGKISPCCAPDKLRDSLGDFGNIQSTDIGSILKSDAYSELVKNYRTNELCQTCNMRKPC